MPHLSLSLLGRFEATLDGEPISAFGTDKARALLAFLAIEAARPFRRAELTSMLWSNLSEKKASHNFSQTLLRLRRALRESKSTAQPFLLVSPQQVQFNPRSDYRLDVTLFRERVTAYQQHHSVATETCPVCIHWLNQAANLYQGELLVGFFVRDSIGFEEWRLVLQESLHGQALDALAQLAAYHEQRGDYEQVQHCARRQVALEPWREEAHIQLMRALAVRGQVGAALEQYETYSRILAQELGLKPSGEAVTVYEQIRAAGVSKAKLPAASLKPPMPNYHAPISAGGERRQVTVLVFGPMNRPEQADPEELHEQLVLCEQRCEDIYLRFGGYRLQSHGEVCYVYFGYPQAYEDAARRAVHTAIEMAARFANHPHPVGIGVHTGMMVVSNRRGPEVQGHELVGEAPAIARGCQRLAKAGGAVITKDTERLVRGWFDCRAVGQRLLPGVAYPLEVYQVVGEINTPNLLDWQAQAQHLTSFVGRESELARLTAYWKQAKQGNGQVILLQGEPGIGKSRLVWELKRSLPVQLAETEQLAESEPLSSSVVCDPSVLWLESRCSPYFQNTSLYPLVGWLEQLLGFATDDSLEIKRDKLSRKLAHFELDHPAASWLLSLLLELPGENTTSQPITAEQREQMRQVFVALLQKYAVEQPVALVMEDLQWSDLSTVEWLGQSFDSLAAVSCLTLLTFRPNFTPPWLPRPYQSLLTLEPLNSAQTGQMVSRLAGERTLDNETCQRIVKQTDGIPLFIEELTKALLESGGQPFELPETSKALQLPVTLRDLLMARLDRLGAAKETAQWASILGREFLYPVLQAITPFDERRLRADLTRLIEAGLVFPQNQASQTKYTFKHSFVQETAYTSLLKRIRQDYHRRVAETLAVQFPRTAKTQPEILAQHYTQAGSNALAVDYWLRAGEHATSQGATLEAKTFFDRALKLIEPANQEQRWRALYGRESVLNLRGEQAARKADILALLELANAFADGTRQAQAYLRQVRYASDQDDYQAMLAATEAALAAAKRVGNLELEVRALAGKVQALTSGGEMIAARQTAEETLAKVQGNIDEVVRAYVLGDIAFYYAESGDISRTMQLISQGTEAARRAGDRLKESRFRTNLGFTYAQLGLYAQARDTLEEGLALARTMGDRRLQANHNINLGFAYWRSGDSNMARQKEEQALKEYRAIGDAYGQAFCLAYLGFIFEEAGELVLAMDHLAQARNCFAQMGLDSAGIEVQAVESRCALAQGRHDEALQSALGVWNYLAQHGTEGMDLPFRVYVSIADIIDAVEPIGAAVCVCEVLEKGYHELMQSASKISDPQWRQSYLENVPENRAIVERWAQLKRKHTIQSSKN